MSIGRADDEEWNVLQGGSLGSWRPGKASGGSDNVMNDCPLSCPARRCMIEAGFLKTRFVSGTREML